VSHAILGYQPRAHGRLADGIVITPSHNPPEDGGIKYDRRAAARPTPGHPQHRGAGERAAGANLAGVRRMPLIAPSSLDDARPRLHHAVRQRLENIVDLEAIARAGLKIGVDPWRRRHRLLDPIATVYNLELEIVNRAVDPTFGFMRLDHDGRIRMTARPRTPWRPDRAQGAFRHRLRQRPDFDRHGIVTRSVG